MAGSRPFKPFREEDEGFRYPVAALHPGGSDTPEHHAMPIPPTGGLVLPHSDTIIVTK